MYLGTLKEKEESRRGPLANFRVVFDPKVHQKIMHWVNKATGEVSGLGKVQIGNDGVILVTSAFLLEQENTGSTTDIEAHAVAKLMFETRDEPGHLNFWWHSHVDMGVFWSGTDMDTIAEIGEQGFLIATVFNKKGEMKSAMYRKSDGIFPEDFKDNLSTNIQSLATHAEVKLWDEDFEKKCKAKVFEIQRYNPTGNYHGNTDDALEDYYRRYPRAGVGGSVTHLPRELRNAQDDAGFAVDEYEDDLAEKEMDEKMDPLIAIMMVTTDFALATKKKNQAINLINHTKFNDRGRRDVARNYVNNCFIRSRRDIEEKAAAEQTQPELNVQ